ncbi:MAG: hydratase [Mesorhizobium sp.]|uniref:2-keto-4-pentenoate hydratase n=1 Tax=Mesorhizobium sp. TaxID=1871066 RepID=UPI000FE4F71B|nr:fumarylacetoacetate hydrolase family protein [Mesorhizobium sp.]RWC98026.1 MAG: hydratase [Mesorhizobium sp.]
MHETWSTDELSQELLALWNTGQQTMPFSHRCVNFDLVDAYKIVAEVARLRRKRGERTVGRKIGFTNRSIWNRLGIAAPIWNFIYDTTVSHVVDRPSFDLNGMPEPRIEPEIVLHLASPPNPGMSQHDLLKCVDWVAPAFEIVFSIFPNWQFTAADAAAAYGVHGALILGERLQITGAQLERDEQLHEFVVELESDTGIRREGHATDVLGGPLEALKFLTDELARRPDCEPLGPGELVTTGTLTEAMPAKAGDAWRARFCGIPISPLELRIT